MPRSKIQETSFIEKTMKSCTLRKTIVFVVVVVCAKGVIDLLQSLTRNPPIIELSGDELKDFPANHFAPQCVIINGTCQPTSSIHLAAPSKGLYAVGDEFYLDGRPFRIYSGSFHYFRTMPSLWGDRLLRMKAAGLNTIMTYIPWNLHEKKKGRYTFGGLWDLRSFIQQVDEVGLHLIIRPGPYICAEWEFGGLPSWLLSEPTMKVRSSSSRSYLQSVENYFMQLFPLLSKFSYKNGGPIVAFQVENEFGSYSRDPEYLRFLVLLFRKYGLNELLFTSDGDVQLKNGTLPDMLAMVNFHKEPVEKLKALKTFQPNRPMMVAEFWSGWFDHWGEQHHEFDSKVLRDNLDTILSLNASINFYMFVGGTNFEFWNGANYMKDQKDHKGSLLAPTVTSYDYDAPVAECGDIKPKFMVIRDLIRKHSLHPMDLPPIPPNPAKAAYGNILLKEGLGFEKLVDLVPETGLIFDATRYMEYLPINSKGGQGYGWILYRTTFPKTKQLAFIGKHLDRTQVFVNHIQQAVFSYWDASEEKFNISLDIANLSDDSNKLDLLVENLGRINYKHLLNEQRKGFQGKVLTAEGTLLVNYTHVPFEFCNTFINNVKTSNRWFELTKSHLHQLPTAYRSSFMIRGNPADTFIDMSNWDKGVVYINGFNMGRYWKKGPQKTLYIPSSVLHDGKNLFTIFEMGTTVKEFAVVFRDSPILG